MEHLVLLGSAEDGNLGRWDRQGLGIGPFFRGLEGSGPGAGSSGWVRPPVTTFRLGLEEIGLEETELEEP